MSGRCFVLAFIQTDKELRYMVDGVPLNVSKHYEVVNIISNANANGNAREIMDYFEFDTSRSSLLPFFVYSSMSPWLSKPGDMLDLLFILV